MIGRKYRRQSFSLIELLVVISIMAVLMALLFPAVTSAREKARAAKCKANLKNLHAAVINYGNDNNFSLPQARSAEYLNVQSNRWYQNVWGWVDWTDYTNGHPSPAQPGITRWWGSTAVKSVTNGTLFPYAGKNIKVYCCPSFAAYCGSKAPDGTPNPVAVRTYAMNSQVSGSSMIGIECSRRLLFTDVTITNRVVGDYGLMVISARGMCAPASVPDARDAWDGCFEGVPTNYAGSNVAVEAIGAFHSGKGNAVFVDGHVETLEWWQTTNACSGNW
jgi:prepilin-type processing-associated H-X9-DG protein/prepilin-type N-terminal cleavage/methylation domain-containing protein